MLFILFALPLALSKLSNKGKSAATKPAFPTSAAEALKMPKTDSKKQWAALSVALAILALSNAYIYLHKPIPIEPRRDLNEFPMQIGLWTAQDIEKIGTGRQRILERISNFEDSIATRQGMRSGFTSDTTRHKYKAAN